MRVTINGQSVDVDNELTVVQLVEKLDFNQPWIAVAVDGAHVPRHRWQQKRVGEGQSVEILAPMQGG